MLPRFPRPTSFRAAVLSCLGSLPGIALHVSVQAADLDPFPFSFNEDAFHTGGWSSSTGLLVSENDDEPPGDAAQGDESEPDTAPDIGELLERIEKLEESAKEQAKEAAEDEAAKKKDSSWDLGGRVHLDNWYFPDSDPGINFLENGDPTHDPEDRWDFRRIRLELQGTVPENMLFRIQVDFNNPSAPEMKDVYLGWEGLPNNHTLLIGNQKRPIGMDHLNSSRHNVFIERPLAVETFNEDARRLGACMYGFSDDEVFNWQYGAFLLENIADDGRYRGDLQESGLYGRLAATPWYDETSGGRGYLHCALAGSVNRTDGDGAIDEDQNSNEARFRTRPMARSDSRWWDTGRILGAEGYQQLAYEAVANVGSLQITSEYFGNWVQRDPLGGFAGDDMLFHGGYIFVNYYLTGEYIPIDRTSGQIDRVKPIENFFLVERCRGGCGSGWGAFSVGLRYDYLDLADSDIQGGRGHAYTASSNWYWTAFSKLQTNLGWGQIDDAGQGRSNVPLLAGVGGEFATVGMRYMIDF
ncbi:MAG: OprO/OprP family phosphate-selective porin [Planctomycetaceae bacterium]